MMVLRHLIESPEAGNSAVARGAGAGAGAAAPAVPEVPVGALLLCIPIRPKSPYGAVLAFWYVGCRLRYLRALKCDFER